ncbi:hypothetical protein E4K72_04565 [Oxalobacteraceae bacterium OM1]|nr:hypothetical protein E4K72_04565 [Oxalobacteraceae bacterium OM1]
MAAASYHKGTWRADVGAEELASGKYQGIVLLIREGKPQHDQIEHRTIDLLDTPEEAVEEASVLAQHLLGTLH